MKRTIDAFRCAAVGATLSYTNACVIISLMLVSAGALWLLHRAAPLLTKPAGVLLFGLLIEGGSILVALSCERVGQRMLGMFADSDESVEDDEKK